MKTKTIYINDQPVYGEKSVIEKIEKLLLQNGARRELEHQMNPLLDESVYMQNTEEKDYPLFGGQPDDHYIYKVFPDLNLSELQNFAKISPEGERLVKKYLRTLGIRISPYVLNELVFFTEVGGDTQSQILHKIFNTISPNSSKFLQIKGRDVLALNTTLLKIHEINPRRLWVYLRNLDPNTNVKVFWTNNVPNLFFDNLYIFLKKNYNEQLENKLIQIVKEKNDIDNDFHHATVHLLDRNNEFDDNFNYVTLRNMTNEEFKRAKNQNNGPLIRFSFTLSNLHAYYSFDELMLTFPKKTKEEEEIEEKQVEEEKEVKEECIPNYEEIEYRIHNSPLNEHAIISLLDKKLDDLDFRQKLKEIIGYLKSENYEKFYDKIWKKDIHKALRSLDYYGNKIFTCERVNSFLDRLRQAENMIANRGEWQQFNINALQ